MIIGVMSDSHDNLEAVSAALAIFRNENVEALIHLGDIISPFMFMRIVEFPTRIIALLGNNDGDVLSLREIALKAGATVRQNVHSISIGNRKILLIHGFGAADQTKEIVDSISLSGSYDAIFYGHTHRVDAHFSNKTLVLNPGEVCGYITGRRSIAIVDTLTMNYRIIEF
ncbi:MAG: metallophosphoesterase [Ignisphaera sp.]|nr:metallophosphoesterase [Ignisphaera sp.]MCX8167944.1 metallophosphoesterase [Ignisphaera sp.]MDW8085541.1 metallophosphoesterase [Ignisphaera sp.]